MVTETPNHEGIEVTSKRFPIELLKSPQIDWAFLDPNNPTPYRRNLDKATEFLKKTIQDGLWTTKMAQFYAEGYKGCKNASEVMDRNTLLKNIVEDRPMDMAWGYGEKENTEMYSALDQMLSLEQLNAFQKESVKRNEEYKGAITAATANLQRLFEDETGVSVSLESPFEGFWRIEFSRKLNGEDYSFYVNISTNKKEVAILSYIPPTEILYAFRDSKSIPLIKDLLEKHPRLNIQLPPGFEKKIKARRQKEKEYQEKVVQLSATEEINPTKEAFESGVYVRQGSYRVIPAEKGPIGTTGVGPCVAVCARGESDKRKLILGFTHMEAGQNEMDVLSQLQRDLKASGVPEERIEMYLIGGWRTTEELQKRLLLLSEQFPIRGIRINMKDKDIEFPEKKNYIDVVITQNGRILFGENGEVVKIKN